MNMYLNRGPSGPQLADLSVVLPVKNGAELIERQIRALLAQEMDGEYEIRIVVNGSDDETLALCKSIAETDPRVQVMNGDWIVGRAAAVNFGVKSSEAVTLVTVDHDDVVLPGWLSGIASQLQRYDVVGSSICLQPEPVDVGKATTLHFSMHLPVHGGFLPYASGSSLGFKRKVFDELGGFDSSMNGAEDVDFSWRAQLEGFSIGFASESRLIKGMRSSPKARFRQHQGYGRAEVMLAQRFRSDGFRGLGKRTAKQSLWLLKHVFDVSVPARRSAWCAVAGRVYGVVHAQIQTWSPSFGKR